MIDDGGATYPRLLTTGERFSEGIWRVDADPFTVDRELVREFNTWISRATFTVAQMSSIFKWSMEGLNLQAILRNRAFRAALCWDLPAVADHPDFFIKIKNSDPACVLNPFAVELAVDFFEDANKVDGSLTALITNVYNARRTGEGLEAATLTLAKNLCHQLWTKGDAQTINTGRTSWRIGDKRTSIALRDARPRDPRNTADDYRPEDHCPGLDCPAERCNVVS